MSAWPETPQPCFAGFEGVSRSFHPRLGIVVARISVGEAYATRHEELICTVLGSCISACIHDPVTCIGGMNHFLLPGAAKQASSQPCIEEQRYGVAAMEALIDALIVNGARRGDLQMKVFGGADLVASQGGIGSKNTEFIRRFAREQGIKVLSDDCGGVHPRRILFAPTNGNALVNYMKIDDAHHHLEKERSVAATAQA
ncbi:MAG: chemoreceptor glutamine deamidase CheD [Pseudomonadota bacterium]